MSELLIKYLLRVAHIGSIIAISHKAIMDFSSGTLSTQHSGLYAVFGIAAMVSGFMNIFILQPKKMGEKKKLWVGYHHLKFLITAVLWTPLAKLIFSESLMIDLRFYWMISIILVAPFMRFYREKYSSKKIQDI